jgi:hypothetical protein
LRRPSPHLEQSGKTLYVSSEKVKGEGNLLPHVVAVTTRVVVAAAVAGVVVAATGVVVVQGRRNN